MDIEKLNDDSVKFLSKIGWENNSIFYSGGDKIFIAWSYFLNDSKNKKAKNVKKIIDEIKNKNLDKLREWLLEYLEPVLIIHGVSKDDIVNSIFA